MQPAYGLVAGGYLTTFDLAQPYSYSAPVVISGLPAGSSVVGIDERPKTGALHAVVRKGRRHRRLLHGATRAPAAATLAAALRNATTLAPIALTGSSVRRRLQPGRRCPAHRRRRRPEPPGRCRATAWSQRSASPGDTFVDGPQLHADRCDAATGGPGDPASAYTQNLA